jgi:nicotinate-nucleotide adenylyltransferase
MREKVCFGGTFNPIHHGHLICARAAAEAVGAKTVVVFPAGSPAHKAGDEQIAPANDRLEMCRLALSARAGSTGAGFELDDREIKRSGPTYTIDTATQLKREGWTEVRWIIGADMVNFLPHWHKTDQLLEEVQFIVMARPGWTFDWDSLPKAVQRLRENIVEVPQIDISATEIRRRVKAGLPIDYLCPPEVCRYIEERGFYR